MQKQDGRPRIQMAQRCGSSVCRHLWLWCCRESPGLEGNFRVDMYLAEHIALEVDGDQHYPWHTQTYTPCFGNDKIKQKQLVHHGYSLMRLKQTWIWNNGQEQWLPHVLKALAVHVKRTYKLHDKTLVVLDIHQCDYDNHITHWKKLGGSVVLIGLQDLMHWTAFVGG